MNLSRWLNLALAGVLAFLVYQRMPGVIDHFRAEGEPMPAFTVSLLDGQVHDSVADKGNRAIVFWATWCGPCGVELRRIQRGIESGEISPESVIAISSFEDAALLRSEAANRHYTFRIGVDVDGQVARLFGISATPTVVLRSRDNRMVWMTSGISPTLIWRMARFFQSENPK